MVENTTLIQGLTTWSTLAPNTQNTTHEPTPPIPIDPPIGKCNYYVNNNNSVVVFDFSNKYGGIPQNLLFNLIGWVLLMLAFTILRRAAGNYGRLALVRRKDEAIETMKWTELFFAPDDVVPDASRSRNSNFVIESHFGGGGGGRTQDYPDSMDYSVVAAEEALLAEDKSFFAWIYTIFTLSDEKFLQKCGSDAVQYIRFQRHLIAFTCIIMIVCIGVILPINFQGSLQGDNNDFGHTTISNLNGTDERLWIHVIAVILFFPLGILIMRRFSVNLQITETPKPTLVDDEEENVESKESYASKTLMITGIPPGYCTKEVLSKHFSEAYPSWPVEDIQPAYDVSKLSALDADRERARKARIACENAAAQNGAGQQMCPHRCGIIWMRCDDCCGRCCSCCRTVDAQSFYTREEHALRTKVEREKAKVKTKSIGIAFVTFASAQGAKVVAADHKSTKIWSWLNCFRASRRPKSSMTNLLEPDNWSARISPPPDDIYWENLTETHRFFFLKSFLINTFVFLFLFFCTSPTYIISKLDLIFSVQSISSSLHLSDRINDFLPTLMLWTLSALLPIIVAYSDWWLGHWRRSAENLWIMRKVFFYLLFMVLVLPSIGLTSLQALVEFVISSRPTDSNSTLRWNCIFLPDNGAFFVNYVITSSLVGTGLEFMRFSELLMYALRMCFARSVAEIASVRKANLYEFPFGFNYGWMLLIFSLTCAYCVVCPLITPFGLVYMVMKHGVDRYNLFYAYKRSKISKQIHATAVNCVIVSLLIQQLVLLFFNIIRGQISNGSATVLSARAIFSITMFTIFSAMFVGQIFFHMFLGVSPIQYTSEDRPEPQNHPSSAATSYTPSADDGGSGDSSANGTEMVVGEFKAFETTDADLAASTSNSRQRSRILRRRQRLQRQFVPEVLRSDVFGGASSTGGGIVTETLMSSTIEREETEDDDATFQQESANYGAVERQPVRQSPPRNV